MHDVGSHNFRLDMTFFKVKFVCNFSIFVMNPKQRKKYKKKTKQNKYWSSNGQWSPNMILFTPYLTFYMKLTIIWYVVYQTFPPIFK